MAKYEIVNAPRFLARTLIYGNSIVPLHIVNMSEDIIEISPFDVETRDTVFEDYPVALIDANEATSTAMSALYKFLKEHPLIDSKDIAEFLRKQRLLIENIKYHSVHHMKILAIKFVM